MSGLRDVVLLIILVGLVPMCAIRPWIGILAWYWVAFMVPHALTWGFARSLPIAVLIGGATLVGFLLSKDRKPLPKVRTISLLLLFIADFTMTTIVSHNPDLSWEKWNWVCKVLLMTLVTMCLFQDRQRLRWLYMVAGLGIGFYGLKGGIWVLRTGGGERVYGPDPSFFGDNNYLGLALCMILPILLYLSREEPRRWLKSIMKVMFGLSVIATVFTYSRGAFLGLTTLLVVLIWRSPWRLRFAMAVLIGVLVAAPFLPDRLWERIESIGQQDSEETRDGSAQGRLDAWRTSLNIAIAHPFAGEGFRALWNDDIWEYYFGPAYAPGRDAHGLYFEVLGEHGFLGLGLYLLIVASALLTLRKIRKRWRGHPEHGYLSNYAEMTQLSLYAFLVAGTFLSVAFFDLYFFFIATTVMLQVLSAETEKAAAPVSAPDPVQRLPLKRRPAPALAGQRLLPPRARRRHA